VIAAAGNALADPIFGHQMSTKSLVDVHQGKEEASGDPQVQ
jgi:hypothetical protein